MFMYVTSSVINKRLLSRLGFPSVQVILSVLPPSNMFYVYVTSSVINNRLLSKTSFIYSVLCRYVLCLCMLPHRSLISVYSLRRLSYFRLSCCCFYRVAAVAYISLLCNNIKLLIQYGVCVIVKTNE